MRAPLVVVTLAFAAGVAAGVLRPVPTGSGPILIGIAALAGLLALHRAVASRPQRARPGVLIFLFLAAGGLSGAATRTRTDASCLRRIPDEVPIRVRGSVVDAVGLRLRLRVEEIEISGSRLSCGAEIPARVQGLGEIRPGQSFRGRGRWWSPPDSRSILRRSGTLLLDSLDVGEAVRPALGPRIRRAARQRVDTLFGERSPMAASLLLAQREGLERELRDQYARAGLSHLLAISGLHVGLLAGIFLLLGRMMGLGRQSAGIVAAVATLVYVALIGAPASAVRAALQIILVLAAIIIQRPARTEALIATAALMLLAVRPEALLQPGFQLSFAGVAGILWMRRPLLVRLRRVAGIRFVGRPVGAWLADGLATSGAATIATAPIVAWHFGQVPVVGVAANLAGIPLLAATVPALALAMAAGLLWVPTGQFLAGGAGVLLDGLDAVARTAAAVPFATLSATPRAAIVWTVAMAMGFVLTRRLGSVRTAIRVAAWAAVATGVLLVAPLRPTSDVELHVIDVGQGDATAIRSPGGRWILVDAGIATADYDAGARRVVPYLSGRGARRLAGLVVTHPDIDHLGGAGAVLDALRPRWCGGPGHVVGRSPYLDLLTAARETGVPWVALRAGVDVVLDGMAISVLHPGTALEEDANAASVVLRVAYGEFEALLMGDAPAEVEVRLADRLGRSGLEADVLKLGHHGSSTSTTSTLLETSGARTALISVGRGNRYGHPHAAVLARIRRHGLDVYRTDRDGTIVIRGAASGRVRVRTERGAS